MQKYRVEVMGSHPSHSDLSDKLGYYSKKVLVRLGSIEKPEIDEEYDIVINPISSLLITNQFIEDSNYNKVLTDYDLPNRKHYRLHFNKYKLMLPYEIIKNENEYKFLLGFNLPHRTGDNWVNILEAINHLNSSKFKLDTLVVDISIYQSPSITYKIESISTVPILKPKTKQIYINNIKRLILDKLQ